MAWRGCGSHAEGSFPTDVERSKLWQADDAANVGRRRSSGAKFAQDPWLRSISTASVRRCRESDDGAGRPARAGRATLAAAGAGWSTRTNPGRVPPRSRLAGHRRSRPKGDSWSASPGAPGRRRPMHPDGRRSRRSRRRVPRPARSSRDRRRRRGPPPSRAAMPGARPIQPGAPAGRAQAMLPRRDSAVPRRGRAAMASPRFPAVPPGWQTRHGSQNWIDQAEPDQALDRPAVVDEMLRLPSHRGLPGNPEPAEVFIDRGLEFRLAAGRVDILDAQQKPAAGLTGQVEIQQGRIGVAQMKVTVRARRKAEDGRH